MHTASGSFTVRTAPPIGYTHSTCSLNRRSVPVILVVTALVASSFFFLTSTRLIDKGATTPPFNAKATGGSWPYLVTVGDSITEYGWETDNQGFVDQLADHYGRYADVRNRGFSGYTTRNLLSIINDLFPLGSDSSFVHHPPELVTVFYGANDAVLPHKWVRRSGEDQHVPIPEYRDNLLRIIQHLRTVNQDLPIILIAPPPVAKRGFRENNHTRPYVEAVKEVGEQAKLPVIDTWALMEGDDPKQYPTYLVDGLHFNAKGNTKLFQALVETIEKNYPDLQVPGGSRLPHIGPGLQ